MFKVLALVCILGGGCILMEESNDNRYKTLEECEIIAQEKHQIITEKMMLNNIPVEHLQVYCETEHESM
tara:strand:+ start:646 stop:852 length:207 start_codon:yes stop_codon:yes gene_type:complete